MFERAILIHYHEIGLKGRNRSVFERRLKDNLDAALTGLPVAPVERIASRLAVPVLEPASTERVLDRVVRDSRGSATPRQRSRLRVSTTTSTGPRF